MELFKKLKFKLPYLEEYFRDSKIKSLEISDKDVLEKSNQKYHPILEFTGDVEDVVEGTLYEITNEELLKADKYEVDDYKRIETKFASGKLGFIYIKK